MKSAALSYLEAGFCVLPASKANKRPAIVRRWKDYQRRLPTANEVDAWTDNTGMFDALCVICGEVSGNLEVIDFDQGGSAYPSWTEKVPEPLRQKLVVSRTQSGGIHVMYRCSQIAGNRKLAQRYNDDRLDVLIETRGEGGLVICAPTTGYKMVTGSIPEISEITPEERMIILQAAIDLNEYDVSNFAIPSIANRDQGGCLRPGDDYNERGDLPSLLRSLGWKRVGGQDDNQYWQRPGKPQGDTGSSATWNGETFYCFSTSTALPSCQGLLPFTVYTILAHGGNASDAARALREQGYGDDEAGSDVDLTMMLQSCGIFDEVSSAIAENREVAREPAPIGEDLYYAVPGFVRDVMEHTLAHAPYHNIPVTWAGAVCLQALLCSRKVITEDGLCPNVYILALAASGSGKEAPRKTNENIMTLVGRADMVGSQIASGEGLEDYLVSCPAVLVQNDEIDKMFTRIRSAEGAADSMVSILLRAYTASNGILQTRMKANQKQNDRHIIRYPHVTLFGTATPKHLYRSLTRKMLSDGLFSRMLVIDADMRDRNTPRTLPMDVPEHVLRIANAWVTRRTNDGDNFGIQEFEETPDLIRVPYDTEAREVFSIMQAMHDRKWDEARLSGDEDARALHTRAVENAKRLALIYACSEDPKAPRITYHAADWACAFVSNVLTLQLFRARSYVSDTDFQSHCQDVIECLRKLGPLRHGELKRKSGLRGLKPREFRDVLEALMEQREVSGETTVNDGPGRTTMMYSLM